MAYSGARYSDKYLIMAQFIYIDFLNQERTTLLINYRCASFHLFSRMRCLIIFYNLPWQFYYLNIILFHI